MTQTVLIVDEDVNARIIAETLLRTRGVPVRIAADGIEACDLVRHQGAAVVVLDLALSGMNGLEVIRRLCGRFEPLPAPTRPYIIVLSDRDEPEVERFALRLGADVFLRKPLNPREFVTTVEQIISGDAMPHEPMAYAG
ncbi:MAG: response regulator [Deltaproteobacteria bacterium]|nr:response regulator [Deltaproteobacteria bacterium]